MLILDSEDFLRKVEKILKGSLDSIPSPSVKIQIMDYVRDGKIQGQCTFKKTKERPCISPSLT